jgi:hypothetical protein
MSNGRLVAQFAAALLVPLGLAGCKPNYPPHDRPTLYATISADGQMVATLANIGTERVRLRVIRLNDDKGWAELPVPLYTTSIKFRMQGHELLLTNDIGQGETSDLSKWNMDTPADGVRRIYRANGLVFPIEVAPDEYLVRSCTVTSENRCNPMAGVEWALVNKAEIIQKYTAPFALNYSWPNVVQGRGFFWMKVRGEYSANEPFPSIKRFALPGGTLPEFNVAELGEDTTDVDCDYQAGRCLRRYIKNWGSKAPGPFVYAAEVLTRGMRCFLPEAFGYFDKISLTPDGNAAVISLAPAYDQSRHVVVMHFKSGQCEPLSVRHIHFNQGDKP